ncbi:MAG: hypothetical protein UV07_C0028G0005 [Candidatus Azambacteria bacterium GW2011_GWB1_42_17]|uniref:Nucleotidyl transferase AbiEii toxin, Type IV TA system n=1 Tax=Candidatus Azambacteria bacterium GW2011_GWB1_42_17 TaxID=1618615 RepID=A0A0G0Z4L1_9BACT|nr:MAG: hypothetical protein UV07_C0028G0005 [Candidatus Azambacteria bacterium GW2011_GWB1_42_17]KKS87272.1 MAG: hypothetical protein UV62_C0031G0005 [Parcubacteria group bacterium GW2011_GWC1_43_11]
MFSQTLLPHTIRGLPKLAAVSTIKKAYLAGGTALALQLGHRISEDLDFFIPLEFKELSLINELKHLGNFREDQQSWQTIIGEFEGTKFSIFYYPYEIIDPFLTYEGLNVVGKKDIAAMKIHALEDRGTKRDFVDVYFLSKEFSLEQMFEFYDQKYHRLDDHLFHIIKSLNYFADADSTEDKTPKMLNGIPWEKTWNSVKTFFEREALRLAKSHLDL